MRLAHRYRNPGKFSNLHLALLLALGSAAMLALTPLRALAEEPFTLSVDIAEAAAPTPQKPTLQDASSKAAKRQERYESLELFQRVLSIIEQNYVDSPENKELMYGAIRGMLETLDPHSNFLTPEVYRDMKVDTSGKFGGVGIEIGIKDDVLTVVSPIEDTPAWKAGVKSGDRLVKIDGDSTRGMTLAEAVQKMRGKPGSEVKLSIWRPGLKAPRELKLERGTVKIQSTKYETLESGFGYVRLTTFNENASADIKSAMAKMEKAAKLRGLILDLRGNPGGLLDQAVEVTSLFVNDGKVVSTIGRVKEQSETRSVRKGVARVDFPIAVLVNSSTASAAEIVAGALQDHHRAIILGQPTFGKGSVQTVMDLGQDLGLKLTIARYYTPSGRSIQEKGVEPDVLLDDFDPKLLETARLKADPVREKDLRGHIVGKDQEKSEPAPGKSQFSVEELELAAGRTKASPIRSEDPSGEDDEFAPVKFEPSKDYQVKEALSYLKSFGVFRRLVERESQQGENSRLTASAAEALNQSKAIPSEKTGKQ